MADQPCYSQDDIVGPLSTHRGLTGGLTIYFRVQ
jgi:hypothetical protein